MLREQSAGARTRRSAAAKREADGEELHPPNRVLDFLRKGILSFRNVFSATSSAGSFFMEWKLLFSALALAAQARYLPGIRISHPTEDAS